MTEEDQFCIDVLEIVPDNSVCFIQSPSCDDKVFLNLMQISKYAWAKQIILTRQNKTFLKALISETSIVGEFNNMTIEENGLQIFEGHDGMEIGELSRNIQIPAWYREK